MSEHYLREGQPNVDQTNVDKTDTTVNKSGKGTLNIYRGYCSMRTLRAGTRFQVLIKIGALWRDRIDMGNDLDGGQGTIKIYRD